MPEPHHIPLRSPAARGLERHPEWACSINASVSRPPQDFNWLWHYAIHSQSATPLGATQTCLR